MKMNQVEYFLMTFDLGRSMYLKGIVQELQKISNVPSGKKLLEIGCGNGIGTRFIHQFFEPAEFIATEYDERLVEVAKMKTEGIQVTVEPGNAADLRFNNDEFDAVIGLSVIHHIPNWKDSLNELHRVTKPGGLLVIKELSIETFETPFGRVARHFVEHPYDDMLRKKDFFEHLNAIGFKVIVEKPHSMLGLLGDFYLVARKER